ncbi:putative methyltransferase DDB_G0268948 [Watersipora subatra]|uniref:putative methyltransferase DDB_G0268948 n=1 Tax=Watersipora subatra TaxID=2589382 RepID=UPI00355BE80E
MGTRYFAGKLVAQNYAIYRPSYPDSVFALCIDFLKNGISNEANKFPLAVDVGCGTGHQSTVPLAKYFDSVLGVDIGEKQIAEAKKSKHPENVAFQVSAGEALPVENETVSLLQVAAAAHWMDIVQFYKEADRVLTPGGVVALFSYASAPETSNHPKSAEIDPILKEIANRPEERGCFVSGNYMVRRRYADECFQIPYADKTRIDNIIHPITNTVEDYIKFCKTLSPIRKMEEAEPDLTKQWMEDATARLLNALETTDMSSKFTYNLEVHMLLGRKPH